MRRQEMLHDSLLDHDPLVTDAFFCYASAPPLLETPAKFSIVGGETSVWLIPFFMCNFRRIAQSVGSAYQIFPGS